MYLTLADIQRSPSESVQSLCNHCSQRDLERTCINVSGLRLERVVLRAIMDIRAHATFAATMPITVSPGIFGVS
jgi:hypothetical protein